VEVNFLRLGVPLEVAGGPVVGDDLQHVRLGIDGLYGPGDSVNHLLRGGSSAEAEHCNREAKQRFHDARESLPAKILFPGRACSRPAKRTHSSWIRFRWAITFGARWLLHWLLRHCQFANYPAASSLARIVARLTALMSVTRKPPASSSRMPSTVQPAGVVTWSLSSAGWYPVSSTILAEPSVVWAASSVATSRGRPTLTPASASASMMMYRNAGPEPESPVTASMCFSSTTTVRPTVWKIRCAMAICSSVTKRPPQSAVIPA